MNGSPKFTHLPYSSAASEGKVVCAVCGLDVGDASQQESIVVEHTGLADDVNHGVDHGPASCLLCERQIHGAVNSHQQRHQ